MPTMQPERVIAMLDEIISYNYREIDLYRRNMDIYEHIKYSQENRNLETLFNPKKERKQKHKSVSEKMNITKSPLLSKTICRLRSFTFSPKLGDQ
ncbi:ATP-dependent helicase [Acrasis kona]|uniref:ATP-dependent helicase n=1 Tax=Acrasis kona TaxID=1008807 RepID=A0AAW2ZP51_9EUKA